MRNNLLFLTSYIIKIVYDRRIESEFNIMNHSVEIKSVRIYIVFDL